MSATEFVQDLVSRAERVNASDIHLQMREVEAEIAFRLDGVMTPIQKLPFEFAQNVFGRIKFLSSLKTYQESLPQDGRIDKASINTRKDVRVATYPTVTGEKIVLRLFNSEAAVTDLASLGFPADALAELRCVLGRTNGLLLLTGPAGSGKTTTIYACLNELARGTKRHIITIEDPVEQVLPGIMQTEVNEGLGLDFARAARHLLRQDPQVLVVGEIRDEQTATIAVRAALTGHLIISTLHAGSCRGVFERLMVLTPDRSSVGSAVELVLNQRLLRRVCSQCSGKGCSGCLQTGYKGRVPVVEWIRVGERDRAAIMDRGSQKSYPTTLQAAAESLVAAAITTSDEVKRVLGPSAP